VERGGEGNNGCSATCKHDMSEIPARAKVNGRHASTYSALNNYTSRYCDCILSVH